MNILITSAGRRVSLVRAFMLELKAHFSDGKVFTADMNPLLSSACQVSDGWFRVSHAANSVFCSELLQICMENNIKMVVPTIDTELKALAANISLFSQNNIELIISDPGVIDMCRDKRITHKFFDQIGLDRPSEIDKLFPVFPLFIKPFDGSSSIGARVLNSENDLTENILNNQKLIFLEYLDPEEYVEYTVDIYFDRSGVLRCAVPRERLEVRGGEVSKGVTRKGDIYDIVCRSFSNCEGFKGCITLQLFRNRLSGKIKAIEINPRFGGGYPLSYRAQANFPKMLIKEYLLGEKIDFYDEWKDNLLMLRYDDEIIVDGYKG